MSITITAREQLLRDILTDAFESGIAYWANDRARDGRRQVYTVNYGTDGVHSIIFDRLAVEDVSGAATWALEVPLDEEGTKLVINVTALENALRAIVEGQAKFGGSPLEPGTPLRKLAALALLDPESVDYDASDADALVQVALFGDVVYG